MKSDIEIKLEQLARQRAITFCYQCYKRAPTGHCSQCGSDDLMLELPGVGVEYGTEWIIRHIIETELSPTNTEEAFEEMIRDCYPSTTTIGFLKDYDTVTAIKELDPVSWRLALSEYEDSEVSDGSIISFDNGTTYFSRRDVEDLLNEG